jgi:carbon monoxide dehydrogenase subunit G
LSGAYLKNAYPKEIKMNNNMNMVELNDEQLDTVAGGYNWQGDGLNINVPINVSTIVPTIVAPTVGVNVLSKNTSITGSTNGILAGTNQQNQ